jgi:hypothetical protein
MEHMRKRRAAGVALGALWLSACAAMTPYQPAVNGLGYSEQKLEPGRYRISFAGNDLTPRSTVEDYLLYRAAELTLAEGHDYFVLLDPSTQADVSYSHNLGIYGSYGRYAWYPRPAFGAGLGTVTPYTQYEAQAQILMRSGKKPADNPRAYDAGEVKKNLEPAVQRPAPATPRN